MRKEVLWASAIGISFGLIIAFGVWRINSSLKGTAATTENTPTPTPTSEFKITLDKPDQDDVLTDSPVTVSGITKPLSWISVSGEQSDYVSQSDSQGVFQVDVALIPGVNQIKVTAFDPQGNQNIEKVLVVYSSSFQPLTVATPSANPVATEDAIRQKVQEKVTQALNKPKAYIGTITDITDSTIQIKDTESSIKQISVDSQNTVAVKTTGTSNKSIKLTDVAIGDFIVAMGYVNSNSVLSAQRILVTDPITEPKISSDIGKVAGVAKKTLTVATLKEGKSVSLIPDVNTDIETYTPTKLSPSRLSGISTGDTIIYVTDNSSDTPVIRAIFVIQKAQS